MTMPSPENQPGTTIRLSFIPTVLAWSDDGTRVVAGGYDGLLSSGTPGFAVIDTATAGVAWHLDGWSCFGIQVAGPLVAVGLAHDDPLTGAASESLLAAHDLISGEQLWQRADLFGPWLGTLSVDPSGHLGVSTSTAYTLLDKKTGRNLAQVSLPDARFSVVSPNGQQLAVADSTRVTILETSTGAVLHVVPTTARPLIAGFDDTGSTLTTVDLSAFVTVVDCASGREISSSALEGLHLTAFSVALGHPVGLSPDRRVVVAAHEGSTTTFSASSGVQLGTLPTDTAGFGSRVILSPDGRAAIVIGVSADAKLVAVPRPSLLSQWASTNVSAASFSRNGRLAVARTSGAPGIGLIDVVAGGPLLDIAAESAPGAAAVLGVDVTGAGIRLVASISADQAARLYSVDGGGLLYERLHPGALTDVVFVRNGQSFATACTDGRVRLFDTVTGEQPWFRQYIGAVNALARPPAGDFICTAGSDKTVRCLDAATGAQRWQAAFPQGVTRVIVSPDAGFVVAACSDRTARLLHIADGTQGWQVQHDHRIRALAVSPDGTLVATASEDGSVRVLASGSGAVRRQASHVQGATSVAFSADGQAVISGSLDGAVLVSPVSDPPAPPAQLLHAAGPVTRIESGAGRSVAVVAQDGLVRIIDLDLQAEIARIYSNAPVNDIAIDTGLLASGSDDGTLRVDTWGSQ